MCFRLTPRAEEDIRDIALRIAGDNPAAALDWSNDILRHCRTPGNAPGLGIARPDVRPDLRTFPVGSYMILCRQTRKGVDIVRVIHGTRQWQRLFDQGS